MAGTTQGAQADLQSQLLAAISARDSAAIRTALDAGADPRAAGEFGRTPLHLAARESAEGTELLLERGANPNAVDGDGRTPLHLAYAETVSILLRYKANFLALDRKGNSALHTAAESDAAMCRLLLEKGLPADVRNNFGVTPLHFATLQGNRNTAEILLNAGADVNARTLAAYQYKWTYVAWDVRGMEEDVPAASTPLAIARAQHRESKWTTQRYKDFAEFLVSRGARDRRASPSLGWLAAGAPLAFVGMFWGIFHLDARMRGWDELATRYSASVAASPLELDSSQDGSVGRIGMIQTRKMLRAAVTPAGLYLAMPRWVRVAHPPLLIPWSQLQARSCERGLTNELALELEAGRPAAGRIFLRGGVAPAVLERIDPVNRICEREKN